MNDYKFNYIVLNEPSALISKVYKAETLALAMKSFYKDIFNNEFNFNNDFCCYNLHDLETLAENYGFWITDHKEYFTPKVFIDNGKGDY